MAGPSSYLIERELTPGRSWRVTDTAGQRLVVKRLPDACLHRDALHPSIHQRLLRLREMPLTECGNLIGVEKEEHGALIVRTYIPGQSLDALSGDRRRFAVDAVRGILESFHRFGLVHGAVSAGNIIVGDDGGVHLIDPSPLLHDDFETDWQAFRELAGDTPPPEIAMDQEARADRRRSLAGAAALVVFATAAAAGGVYFLRG